MSSPSPPRNLSSLDLEVYGSPSIERDVCLRGASSAPHSLDAMAKRRGDLEEEALLMVRALPHSKQRARSSRSPHTAISLYSLTPTALSPFLVSRRPSSLPLPPPRAHKGISRRRSQRRSRPRTHCLWTRRRPSRTSSRRLSTIINRRDMYAYLCPMGERDACGGS